MFANSAPLNPAVFSAIFFKSISSANFLFFAWILRISSLSLTSGRLITIVLSNLPGLNNASSNISGLFVAAITITDCSDSKPSISTNNWFSVWLFSVSAPIALALLAPIASISSMNIIHGAIFLALSNNFLTLDAPSPANNSTNSEPLIEMNGTFASPAIAFAIKVLPVPGFPENSTPCGTFAPISLYLSGFFKKSMISIISFFSSSNPATSSNFTSLFDTSGSYTLPFFPTPCISKIKYAIPNIINVGKNLTNPVMKLAKIDFLFCSISTVFPDAIFWFTNSMNACVFGIVEFFFLSSGTLLSF